MSWKSSKPTYVAWSTMEYEFIGLEKTCSEAEWLKNLVGDLHICEKPVPSVSIHYDSQGAIAKAKTKYLMEKVGIYA